MKSTIKQVLRVEFEERRNMYGMIYTDVQVYVGDRMIKGYGFLNKAHMGAFERSAYYFILNHPIPLATKETVKKGFLNRFLRFFKSK